jgi:DNA-binding NarL/FixJ family response regulator
MKAAEVAAQSAECLAAGRRWLPRIWVKGPLERENVRRRLAEDISERLTRREREVALLIVDGLTVNRSLTG